MANVWGMWLFFYIPAFLCGCAVGGAAMFALAKKIITSQAKKIVLAKKSAGCRELALRTPRTLRTPHNAAFRKAC